MIDNYLKLIHMDSPKMKYTPWVYINDTLLYHL